MVYMKLGDICSPKQWKTISTSELTSEGYPVYGANGIIGYYKEFNHIKETILVTCRGATCGSVNITRPYSYVNGNAMALDNLDERFDINYLYFYLSYRGFNDVISGSAQPQIIRSAIEKILIPLYPIEQQRKIASLFIKINNIHDLYRKENDRLDELIKSRFVEMFGNPVANEKGWEISLCKNLMSKIGSGATPKGGKESYCDEGISLIRSMNVYNNRFEYKDLAHITDDQAGQLENVTIEKKDVLLNITGASVARCCVVPDDLLPARVNQHVSIIRCKERILPEFLCCMFTEDNYQRLLWNIATAGGATREAITKQQIEELMLIVPPIDLQRQYITFVKWIDKSKSAVQAALDKTQLLFDSLMQEYFG